MFTDACLVGVSFLDGVWGGGGGARQGQIQDFMLGGWHIGGVVAWPSPNQQEKRYKLPPVAWGLHREKTPTAFHLIFPFTL